VGNESDTPNAIFEDEASRLKKALKLCHNVVANYRAMLIEGSNDNSAEEAVSESMDSKA
jgi:hypothetical protein